MASMLKRLQESLSYTIRGIRPDTWFSPLQPLQPMEPQTKGRAFDYIAGQNLNYRPRSTELVGFRKLRVLAERSNLLQMVMFNQMNLIEAFEWSILPKAVQGKRPKATANSGLAKQLTTLLMEPEPGYDWGQWVRRALWQVWVYDALTIYPRKTLGGDPYSLDLIDGSTLTPLLDANGRRPIPPSPAYEQVLKGVVTSQFSLNELIYFPKDPRVDKLYGHSRVQMIIDTVETEIERMASQRFYFTAGNAGDGIFTGPEEWSADQIKSWQGYWDDLFSGNLEQRRHGWWVPNGVTWQEIKQPPLKDEFDEWLARKICFAFSCSPAPFIKQQNRSNQEGQQEVAEEGGIANDMAYLKRVIDRTFRMLGVTDLEFVWSDDREFDPTAAAQIDDLQLKNGTKVINEIRERLGEDPIDGGDTPLLYTASGWTRLEDVLEPPDPVLPPGSVVASPGADDPADPPPPKTGGKPPGKKKIEDAPKAGGGEKKAPLKKVASEEPSLNMDRPAMRKAVSATTPRVAKVLAGTGADVAHQVMRRFLVLGKADEPKKPSAEDQADDIVSDLDLSKLEALVDIFEPVLSSTAGDGAEETIAKVGVDNKDELTGQASVRTVEWAKTRAAELVGKKWQGDELIDNPNPVYAINETTRDRLRDVIARELEAGTGHQGVADAIKKDFAFSDARADLITHTEIRRANSEGALIGAREAAQHGVDLKKLWLVGLEPCPICVINAASGSLDLDEDFPSGDSAPPGHPGCFCSLSWDVKVSFD